MDRDEMREEITNLLLQSETVDKEPPFRILPQGNNGWAEIKAGRLLSLLAPVFEKAGKWEKVEKMFPNVAADITNPDMYMRKRNRLEWSSEVKDD